MLFGAILYQLFSLTLALLTVFIRKVLIKRFCNVDANSYNQQLEQKFHCTQHIPFLTLHITMPLGNIFFNKVVKIFLCKLSHLSTKLDIIETGILKFQQAIKSIRDKNATLTLWICSNQLIKTPERGQLNLVDVLAVELF